MLRLFTGILLILFAASAFAQVDTTAYKNNPNYKRELEFYKISKTKQADIVMLGNSLTKGADWDELLGRKTIVNRGIVSDVLRGYLNRLEYVYNLNPKVCLIMGGINDIYNWNPTEEIFKTYVKVIERLKAHGIKPIIQSTLYAGKSWGKEWIEENRPKLDPAEVNAGRNKEVDRLNNLLKDYAEKHNIQYVDINSKVTRGRFLRSELNYDGLHLNPAGYEIWAREVNEVLRKLGL